MFALPSSLVLEGFSLRPESEADIPFLAGLFASTRAEEMERIVEWTAEQKQAFLFDQFRLQRHHYYTHFPNCEFLVLERNGMAGGRIYLDSTPNSLDLIDISLLPQWRGQGTGTTLLDAVIDAARAGGRRVTIFVEKFNPALNLYRRLGFREITDTGLYLEMEWRADAAGNVS